MFYTNFLGTTNTKFLGALSPSTPVAMGHPGPSSFWVLVETCIAVMYSSQNIDKTIGGGTGEGRMGRGPPTFISGRACPPTFKLRILLK